MGSRHEIIQPEGWATPIGYANGVLAGPGRLLCLGGQVAFDEQGRTVCVGDLVGQMRRTLQNLKTVVETTGGTVEDICKLTIFVQDKDDYIANGIKDLCQIISETHLVALRIHQATV